jgi:hypothetical protein
VVRRDTSPPPPSPALSVDAPISGGGWGHGDGGGGGGSGYAASAMRILTRRAPERAVLILNDDLEIRKEQGLKREETRAQTLQESRQALQESTSPSLLPVERMKHLLSAVESRLNPPPTSLAAAVGVGGDAVACGEAEAGGVVGCEALESEWTATLGQKQIVPKTLFGAQPPTS